VSGMTYDNSEEDISIAFSLNKSLYNDPKTLLDLNFPQKILNTNDFGSFFGEEDGNKFAFEQKLFKTDKSENNLTDFNYLQSKEDFELEKKNENSSPPVLYTSTKIIKEIFPKINDLDDLKKKYSMDIELRKIEKDLSFIGKKRRKNKIKYNDIFENNKKPGRKKLNDYTKRRHSKNSSDNIIKKIKSKFLEYSLKFINKVLNSNLNKKNITYYNYLLRKKKKEDNFENLIKALDYKYVNRIKKDSELSLLDKSLKEVFSQDISSKYSRLQNDSNKTIIERIVIDEKDNDIIMFALNLTLREWIDVFIYKKELKDITKINNLSLEKINQLSSLFDRVDNLLLDIYQKDCNKNYLSHFISLMYNYERWFYIKRGRSRSS
jgi:hypothetical protein